MANVIINGTLILDGNLNCDGNVTVTSSGLVIPVPNPNLMGSFYSPRSNSFITSNGCGRAITSLAGSIEIQGLIDGRGQGFLSDQGPGCNSLIDSSGNHFPGYGATHAGLGEIHLISGAAPTPKSPYGNRETPVSLGSGSGSYHDITHFYNDETPAGGGAIKLEALSGEVAVDGTILMDGHDGGLYTGGAAGGSVWLYGWLVGGAGMISAEGGQASSPNTGGGGGGYISVWYDNYLTFTGTASVAGRDDGKIFITHTVPHLEENFTGTIWNTKWWNPPRNSVSLNNEVSLASPQNDFNFPSVSSIFSVSGKSITAQIDYTATTVSSHYSAKFLLMSDPYNWVGLARHAEGVFGVSSVDGFVTSVGVLVPLLPSNTTFRIVKVDSTFAYQYFDATSATPLTIYTDVIPELENLSFNVFLGLDKPDSSLAIEQRRLCSFEVDRQYMQLDATPFDASSTLLNVYGGPPQYYGADFTVAGGDLVWDMTTSDLGGLLAADDRVRVAYGRDPEYGFVDATFDSFKLYRGVVADYETTEPVLYVDSVYGSDSSNGQQLSPLKNLFVATAWAKRGSTIVLYDGTHNPSYIAWKDLTIRGAEGASPLITSQYVQDTVGSGWETNGLSFYACQGIVTNVQFTGSQVGIRAENSPLIESIGNVFHDATTGIRAINCDPVLARNKAYNMGIAFDFTACRASSYIYSNLIYDSSIAVNIADSSMVQIIANTIDGCVGGVVMQDSTVITSSNNLTNSTVGIQAPLGNSWYASYYNNYYADIDPYSRNPDVQAGNINVDPMYVDTFSTKNYHLLVGSADISSGQVTYDQYFFDFDGVTRPDSSSDIGAFQFIPDGSYSGNIYVTSAGDDHINFGSFDDPFRTLDKAMLVETDSTVIYIDTGHYDSYYLKLRDSTISSITFHVPSELFLIYNTVTAADMTRGGVQMPAFVDTTNISNVAVSIVGGGPQIFGVDYGWDFGEGWDYKPFLSWKGFALDGTIAEGDIIRTLFTGTTYHKAFTNLVLHNYYSNLDKGKAVYVSPSGSDSTVLGGDGTNTGGNGTFALPYRTIDMALSNSNPGDFIVAMAGEYPLFTPIENRVLVPAVDQTAVDLSRRFYEDFFAPNDFRAVGTSISDMVPWSFDASGQSTIEDVGGFLNMTFDGSNTVSAVSSFQIVNDFQVSAVMVNSGYPVYFTITSPDNTMFFSYDQSNYKAGIMTGGITYTCQGVTQGVSDGSRFVTDYINLDSNDIIDKRIMLPLIPTDSTNVIVTVVGGSAQVYGEDFVVQGTEIVWEGLGLDGELIPGDTLRVSYSGENFSNPLPVTMSLKGSRFTIQIKDPEKRTVNMRDMVGSYVGPWTVSFYITQE